MVSVRIYRQTHENVINRKKGIQIYIFIYIYTVYTKKFVSESKL